MGTYFHGWRRKIGVMTLVMACVFAGGWVRSKVRHDYAGVKFGNAEYRCGSLVGYFSLITFMTPNGTRLGSSFGSLDWNSGSLADVGGIEVDETGRIRVNEERLFEREGVNWRWDYAGFHLTAFTLDDGVRGRDYTVPYWSIVLPLTMLSAFLLLFKPRQSIKTKTTEPITTERK